MTENKEKDFNALLKHSRNGLIISRNYYNLVSKHNVSKEDLVEYLMYLADNMIEEELYDSYKELESVIWKKLSDNYTYSNKFNKFRYGNTDRDIVKNLLLNLNKTNHKHINMVFMIYLDVKFMLEQ